MNCHELCCDTSSATEARIRNVVYRSKSFAPCVLCLRNIDALGRDRDGAGEDLRVAASFGAIVSKAQADGAKFPLHVVATTSCLQSVSKDIQQAFLYSLHVEALCEATRERILTSRLQTVPLHYSVNLRHVAQRTAVSALIVYTVLTTNHLVIVMTMKCVVANLS